ncbi:MAG: EAL domain-containing protein [Paracoccaceae bacterium]|nr:EAL domain-containing protein [Paracoccaceae bacterium]
MDALTPYPADITDPLSTAVAQRDRDVVAMAAKAVAAKRVQLAYQPVIVAGSGGRLAFFEGLMRILDPTGRPIPAREFIGEVEDKELGRRIDCIALEAGIEALAANPTLRLSVNMSARSIGYPAWLRTLDEGIGLDPDIGARLIVEITESSVLSAPETVAAFMAELQTLGVCFAMDDFGAGFTSLRHLRDLDFDILKIDGTFVNGIHANPDNKALTSALLSVGRHFGMLTVAENVETAADAAWLSEAGVDCLQGYYFGAPSLRPDWSDRGNLGAIA